MPDMKKYTLLVVMLIMGILFINACKEENGDNNKPFIVVLGLNPVFTPMGQPYDDAGAEAWDVTETGDTINISNRLQVNSNVNTDVEGNYEVKYNVSDEAGNNADEKTRDVRVVIGK